MKAICYVLIKQEGAKLRKVTHSLERVASRSDEGLLETYAPSAGGVAAWADKGWTLCNWHIVNCTDKPKRKTL